MQTLSLAEFGQVRERFDEAVEATPDIDHFCSASDWILPASQSLMPEREPWIRESDGCFWAFMRAVHPAGFHYLEPLEAMWALACPVVGADVGCLVDGLRQLCETTADWHMMALAGMPQESPVAMALARSTPAHTSLRRGPSSKRLVADLRGGFSEFLGRRSKQFRRGITRSQRRAAEADIAIVDACGQSADTLFSRILAVEERGWKGRAAVGITEASMSGMYDFYRMMMPMLWERSAQRVLFAVQGGLDVGYIFGGLRGSVYRGLQFSFDEAYREYGLGNLMQIEQIRRLCEEGVETYDLGTFMDYKIRWADREHQTETFLVVQD